MRDAPLRGPLTALTAATILSIPVAAEAADVPLSIPEQPREAALMALAAQAGLSLGFAPGARCGGQAGLAGHMSVEAALARLLAGSSCEARRPNARTIVILSARPAPREAAPAPAAPRPPTDLAETVVTADKTEQLLSQTPSALTAADGPALSRAGVTDVRDLPLLAAGVTVTNLGPGRDKVILRGLSDGPLTGHTQSTVGLYLGDLRLTYNAPDPDLPLADVARVEVLRGPQGSLWGAGSIGGILHVVPNAPDPSGGSGRLEATVSSTIHGAPSYSAQGIFNTPLANGTAALRVVAWTETAGGTIDDRARSLSDIDRSRRRGARASLSWRPAPDLGLDAMVVAQNIATRDAHYADPAVGPLARASAIAQPHDNDFLAASLSAHWTPAWGSVTASLGALDHDVGTTYDAAAAPADLAPAGTRPRAFDDRNEIRAVVGEIRAASTGSGPFRWKAGLFASEGDQRLAATLGTVQGADGYAERRRDRLHEAAAFGEAAYDLTPNWTLALGGRLFAARLRTRSDVSAIASPRAFADQTHSRGLAPRFVLAYRPAPRLTIYAQAAEGYRTSGFNTGGPPGQAFASDGGVQPLRRYGGDELWSYEAGARWQSPRLGLTARLAAFQADWNDIQADLLLPSGLPFTADLGVGRSRGIEAEAKWSRGGLELGGNLTAQEPELRRPAPGLPARADSGLPGVPRVSFVAFAAYAQDLDADWRFSTRASYAYVGASRLVFDAVTAPRMGGYGDLRLSLTLTSPAMSVGLFAENLLDRRGDTLAYGNPFLLRRQVLSTPQRPRTVGLAVGRNF